MLKHARQGNTITVKLDGELDQDSASRVRQELDDLISDARIKHLVLDMQGLTFMDSSGIGVVIGRYRTLATRGGGVAVRGESPHVQRIMKLSGLYSILEDAR
ncbi:MAG: anti-sigma factor antagonist [Oscillospiraceae bacterium]|jgi:stage II sporulation protein AA (anti-sigma F factor antagonist)|nr:anti-sigma factor antagonist [Oscillospiraceae bacterium]